MAPIVTLGFPEEQAFLKDAGRTPKAGHRGRHRRASSAIRSRSVASWPTWSSPPAAVRRPRAEARRIFADELADVGEVS